MKWAWGIRRAVALVLLSPGVFAGTEEGAAAGAAGQMLVSRNGDYIDVVLSLPGAVVPPDWFGVRPARGAPEAPPYFFKLSQTGFLVAFPGEGGCHTDGDWMLRVDKGPSREPTYGAQPGQDGELPLAIRSEDWVVVTHQFHCVGVLRARGLPWLRMEIFDQLPALAAIDAEAPGDVVPPQRLTPTARTFSLAARTAPAVAAPAPPRAQGAP
jgi:hypothetical protein